MCSGGFCKPRYYLHHRVRYTAGPTHYKLPAKNYRKGRDQTSLKREQRCAVFVTGSKVLHWIAEQICRKYTKHTDSSKDKLNHNQGQCKDICLLDAHPFPCDHFRSKMSQASRLNCVSRA